MQQNLPQIEVAESRANRGKIIEEMLNSAHRRYEFEHKAKIYNIPNAYRICSPSIWRKLPAALKATTGTNRCLQRIKTPFDFFGVAQGQAVAFDAKEFAQASIPLANFEDHQVASLVAVARAGGLGGFMIYAKRTNQVFWLDAFQVQLAKDRVYGKMGKGEWAKSFNLAALAEDGIIIGQFKPGDSVDWMSVLISEQSFIRRE